MLERSAARNSCRSLHSHRELCAHEATSPFKVVNFLELVGEAMGVEKPDLFKQWKMMQDIDRILAEVAAHAAVRIGPV